MDVALFTIVTESISKGLSLIKNLSDSVSDAKSKEEVSKLFDIIINLQSKIFAIQSDYQKMLQSNNDLSQKLVDAQKWANDKSNYEIFEPDPGTFVYIPKSQDGVSKPNYWLCTNCFDNYHIKSVLQKKHGSLFYCPHCNSEFRLKGDSISSIQITRR